MARPRRIRSVAQMQRMIEAYFKSCEAVYMRGDEGEIMLNRKGQPMYKDIGRPPTMTGLARALGLSGRQSLLNYAEREEFVDAIKQARTRVEQYAEERLYDRDGVAGAKFNLMNNFGWREKLDAVTRDGGTYTDEEARAKLALYTQGGLEPETQDGGAERLAPGDGG